MGDFSLRNYFSHSLGQGKGCPCNSLCIVVPASRFQAILHLGWGTQKDGRETHQQFSEF